MGGVQKGEEMTCSDCLYLKCYRGRRDRYGIQTEPDDYECVGKASKEDRYKYFFEAEDDAEHCEGFKSKYKEDYDE